MTPLTEAMGLMETNAAETDIVIIAARSSLSAAPFGWRPAVNAYRCDDRFVVFVDLAGVPRETIELAVEPTRLVIRGRRPAAEPPASADCHLLALEIDQGFFERTLEFPQPVEPADVSTEYRDGIFRISIGART